MIKRGFLLPFCLSLLTATAQIDTSYLSHLHREIRKIQPVNTIHYAPGIMEYAFKACKKALKAGKTIYFKGKDSMATIRLTKKERDYVLQQLKESVNNTWKRHMVIALGAW